MKHRRPAARRRAHPTAALALAVSLVATASCSGSDAPTRSVANFCSTYTAEKAKFTTKYAGVGRGGGGSTKVLSDLVQGFESLGDVTVILTKLDAVAPNDIEPDVAAVLDSWKQTQGTLGDEASNALNPRGLVGAMLRGILVSLESQGSWQRVGDYITKNCGSNA